MSSQIHNLLDVQYGVGKILRHDSYHSSQSSGQESYGSGNESNSQSEGSSRKTPSEYSLPTPDDDQPDIDQFYFGMDADMPAFAINNTRIKRLSDDSNAGGQSLSLIRPEMLASLTSHYDYKLNRYSSVNGISDMQQFEEDSEEEDESEGGEEFDVDFDDDDMYSPIEIARPVSLVIVQEKPAVVSIGSPRSPSFPPSEHDSSSRQSLDSRNSAPHSRSSSIDKALPSVPQETEDMYEEETHASILAQSHIAYQTIINAPSAVPPRRTSSRMSNLKKLIRTTSSQLLDIKEEGAHHAPKLDRRDSTASSIYSRAPETPRNPDFGAFIISHPATRTVSGPSVVIPTRSTSRRHSKDLTTSPTAPPLAPRNPRRNVGRRPLPIHESAPQETWV